MPDLNAALDAALAEMVYHRAESDQSLTLDGIDASWRVVEQAEIDYANLGLKRADDGYLYNTSNGFTALVIAAGANYKVVYRGTDAGSSTLSLLKAAIAGASDSAIDGGDITADIQLGGGVISSTSQAADAIRLAQAVKALAGPNGNVTLIGQSLGGGLAGVAAAVLGLPAVLISPAPFLLRSKHRRSFKPFQKAMCLSQREARHPIGKNTKPTGTSQIEQMKYMQSISLI